MEFIGIDSIFVGGYYAIPDYQRDYEWTDAQNDTLIDDIFIAMEDDSEVSHFFGALVTIPYEKSSGYNKVIQFKDYRIKESSVKHIVDGQQRLTSISILLSAINDIIQKDETISKQYKKVVGDQIENYITGIHVKDYVHKAPRLILNGNTGKCYNCEILHVSKEKYKKIYKGAKRVLNAYKTFTEAIIKQRDEVVGEKRYSNNEKFYQKLVDTIQDKVVFVEIKCDESSDAFQVFDSLNGKGLDLTAADRIKNIFMSWSKDSKGIQKWDALVDDIGDDYLVNFFIAVFFYSYKKRIPKNKLPDKFKENFKDTAQDDWSGFFNGLKEDGILYGKLRNHKTSSKKLNELLKDFEALRFDQIYVILFAVAKHHGTEVLKEKDYYDFAQTLLTFVVRMQVCEKSMNKLDTIFGQLIDKMRNDYASIKVITKTLYDEMKKMTDDEHFEIQFANFNPADNRVAEYYLRQIENYLRRLSGERTGIPRSLTVEHVIPQLYDIDTWYGENEIPEEIKHDFKELVVENIGNKLLLYGDDNSSASNDTYDLKKKVYKNGKRGQDEGTPIDTFKLVEELINDYPNDFLDNHVKERAKRMAEYAIEIWK